LTQNFREYHNQVVPGIDELRVLWDRARVRMQVAIAMEDEALNYSLKRLVGRCGMEAGDGLYYLGNPGQDERDSAMMPNGIRG
jgi:hypothetical protein